MKKLGRKITVTKDLVWKVLQYKEQNPTVSMDQICRKHGFSFMHLRVVIKRHKEDSDYDQLIAFKNRVIEQGSIAKITLEMMEETIKELELNPNITRQGACEKRGFKYPAFRYNVNKHPELKLRMKKIRLERTPRKVYKESVDELIALLRKNPMPQKEACQQLGFSLTTLKNYLLKNPQQRKIFKSEKLGLKKYLPTQ